EGPDATAQDSPLSRRPGHERFQRRGQPAPAPRILRLVPQHAAARAALDEGPPVTRIPRGPGARAGPPVARARAAQCLDLSDADDLDPAHRASRGAAPLGLRPVRLVPQTMGAVLQRLFVRAGAT